MKLSWSPAAAAARKKRKLLNQASCLEAAAPSSEAPCAAPMLLEEASAQHREHVAASLRSEAAASVEQGVEGDPSRDRSSPSPAGDLGPSSKETGDTVALSRELQNSGNVLAEKGDFSGALAQWASALALTPANAAVHESRAQVLLEMGDTWQAVQAASRATELEPGWAEGWITLCRAQLNFGEPLLAHESASRATKLSPDSADAQRELRAAQHLLVKQRQLEHEQEGDAARLAACGFSASPLKRRGRVRVVERRSLELDSCGVDGGVVVSEVETSPKFAG